MFLGYGSCPIDNDSVIAWSSDDLIQFRLYVILGLYVLQISPFDPIVYIIPPKIRQILKKY